MVVTRSSKDTAVKRIVHKGRRPEDEALRSFGPRTTTTDPLPSHDIAESMMNELRSKRRCAGVIEDANRMLDAFGISLHGAKSQNKSCLLAQLTLLL
jgi:hypothetical protein